MIIKYRGNLSLAFLLVLVTMFMFVATSLLKADGLPDGVLLQALDQSPLDSQIAIEYNDSLIDTATGSQSAVHTLPSLPYEPHVHATDAPKTIESIISKQSTQKQTSDPVNIKLAQSSHSQPQRSAPPQSTHSDCSREACEDVLFSTSSAPKSWKPEGEDITQTTPAHTDEHHNLSSPADHVNSEDKDSHKQLSSQEEEKTQTPMTQPVMDMPIQEGETKHTHTTDEHEQHIDEDKIVHDKDSPETTDAVTHDDIKTFMAADDASTLPEEPFALDTSMEVNSEDTSGENNGELATLLLEKVECRFTHNIDLERAVQLFTLELLPRKGNVAYTRPVRLEKKLPVDVAEFMNKPLERVDAYPDEFSVLAKFCERMTSETSVKERY